MTNQNGRRPPNSNQAEEAAKALVATDVAITQKPFLRYVTGSITNSSDHRFSYLVVKIELLDENRRVVSDVADAILDFGPGQIWNFQAGIIQSASACFPSESEIYRCCHYSCFNGNCGGAVVGPASFAWQAANAPPHNWARPSGNQPVSSTSLDIDPASSGIGCASGASAI